MVEVLDAGVQAQKFLRAFPPPESLLLSLLTPCGTMGLLDDIVAASRGDHWLMVDPIQAGKVTDCGTEAAELIRVDDLWDVVFTQEPSQEFLRSFGVSMPLKEDIEHETVLVHRPPQPMPDAVHARTDLVKVPAGTPTGFPLAKVFSKEGSEFEAPFAESFVTDLNAALVEQFLNVSVAQGKAVVQPDGVLNDGHGETVAVRFWVGHGGSTYLSPVKSVF